MNTEASEREWSLIEPLLPYRVKTDFIYLYPLAPMYDWCYENIGTKMLCKTIFRELNCYEIASPISITRNGVWTRGAGRPWCFYFQEPQDAVLFRMVWQ